VSPGVPADLDAITMRLLQRDPSARYRTARDVIAALRGCAAAPRDGRVELRRLLAERFPERARPVPPLSSDVSAPGFAGAGEPSSPGAYAFAVSSPGSGEASWPARSTTGHAVGEALEAAAPRARRGRWLAAIGLGLTAAVTITAVRLADRHTTRMTPQATEASPTSPAPSERSLSTPAPDTAHVASSPPVAPTPQAPAAPTSSTLTIATNPPGATVRIDAGSAPLTVARSPLTVQVTPGVQLHIRAELEGFQVATQDATIEPGRQSIVVTLAPLETETSAAKTVKRPAPTPSTTPGTKPTTSRAPTPKPPSPNHADPEIIE